MGILEAAAILRPGTAWSCDVENGVVTNLRQAEDGTLRVSIPSTEDLQELMGANAYAEKRRKEYPSLVDQLDAIWKGSPSIDAMREQVLAVKAKYPKPE